MFKNISTNEEWVLKALCVGLLLSGTSKVLADTSSSVVSINDDSVRFVPQPGFFQVVSGQLNALDPKDGVYTKMGAKNQSYNAAGYNVEDNFVYAWGRYAPYKDQLVRIHGDGSFLALGKPVATGATVPTFHIYAGDMDYSGNLWVRGDRFYSPDLMKIDVSSGTYEMVRFTGPNPGGVADLVYQEREGVGYFYGTRNQDLYVWNTATLSVSKIPVKNLPTGRIAYGAAYTDQAGSLFVSSNKGGVYQVVNHTTDNPRAVFLLDSVRTGNNDGFSCPLESSPLIIPANQAPTISVEDGSLIAKNGKKATIDLSVNDEGLPMAGDGLQVQWTHETGPGTVRFSEPEKAKTDLSFPKNGHYVVRCSASDGEYTSTEDFVIDVSSDQVQSIATYSLEEADYDYARKQWANVKHLLHCRKNGTSLELEKRGFDESDYILSEDSEVIVTAIYDGGTYANTLFWYGADNSAIQEVVWQNYILGPTAPLKSGSRASLGVLPAGTQLRFGLVVDGGRGGTTLIYQDSALNLDGLEQCAGRLYAGLQDGPRILAFEDQVRGDEDFNDVIFEVNIIPRSQGDSQYDDVIDGRVGLHSDRGRRGVERHLSNNGMDTAAYESIGQLYRMPNGPLTIEFLEDRSSMKSDLCVFDYDQVKHLDPSSLEFRQRAAEIAVSIFDDRLFNPGGTANFDPSLYGLEGKDVGLMCVPNNVRSVFLRNPFRYTAKGEGNRTKRQPLFSLVDANPGRKDQILSFSSTEATMLCFEDHTRHEDIDFPEAGDVSNHSFDDMIVIIRGGLLGVNHFDGLYGLPTVDQTEGFTGEDGNIARDGVKCY